MSDIRSSALAKRFATHLRRHLVGYLALLAFAVTSAAQATDGPLAGQNTVGSDDIIGNEVKSDDIANGRIFNLDFADETIQSGKVLDGTLTGADFAPNSITGGRLDESTFFNDDSLTTLDVNETDLFNDDSLTSGDLFSFAAGASEIALGAVRSQNVIDGVLDEDEIGPNSVNASEIGSNEVGSAEVAPIVIQRESATIAANSTIDVTVNCPAGYTVLNLAWAGAPGLRSLGGTAGVNANLEPTSVTLRFDNESGGSPSPDTTPKAAEAAAICLEG